ncbi:hypothetical protein D3C80_1313070 [compost metagenome]
MCHFSITARQVSDSAVSAVRYIVLCAVLRNVIKHLSLASPLRGMLWRFQGGEDEQSGNHLVAGHAGTTGETIVLRSIGTV